MLNSVTDMKKLTAKPEFDLIRILKYFAGGVTLVFLLLLFVPGPVGEYDVFNRKYMLYFAVTYGVIFFYLLIPGLEEKLKNWYLPPVLLAASLVPLGITNGKYRALLEAGFPINTLDDTMTLTVLLIFPLVITAWKYSFPIVFLFFVVLGFLDPLMIILANESFTPEIYGAFNASLIRILALGSVGFMITELRDIQRAEKRDLIEANRKLEDYARASERLAASRERNRIARDMHDTLAHTLSGLAIQLEAVETVVDPENTELRERVDRAKITVRDGLGETRRALKAMRASPLEELGVLLALERLAEEAGSRDDVTVVTTLPLETPDWDDNLEEGIYRIAQEGLENVVRHAGASKAELILEGDESGVILEIRDNGRGFDDKNRPEEGRFGMKGMAERAAALGGTLEWKSAPGRGTAIRFKWSQHE